MGKPADVGKADSEMIQANPNPAIGSAEKSLLLGPLVKLIKDHRCSKMAVQPFYTYRANISSQSFGILRM